MNERHVATARGRWRIPALVSGIYACVGITYILVSDLLLARSTEAPTEFAFWGMFKGVCYVLVTAGLIFWLIARCIKHLESARAAADRRAGQQAVIADVGQQAVEGVAASRLIEEAPVHAARQLQAHYAALLELAPEGNALLLRAAHPGDLELIGRLRIPNNPNSLAGYTLQVNEPVIVSHYATDGRFQPLPEGLEAGVVSCATVVLRGRDRPLGVLGVYTRTRRLFSADDASFLRALANVVSHAIERERAERTMRRQNELLRRVTDSAPLLLGLLDAAGRLVWCNSEWSRLTGAAQDQATGGLAAFLPDPREREAARQQLLSAGGRWFDLRLRLPDGRTLDTVWFSTLLSDGAALCIGTDVTERRRLQEQLIHTQKLEAVALLAGGVAHDFNNLLTAFLGYADLARQSLAGAPPNLAAARDALEMIERTADRASALTRQILIYCRRDVSHPAIVDPSAIVREMEPMLQRLLGEHILIRLIIGPRTPRVLIDPGRLEQAVMNLAINARDAMSAGGTLTIETGNGTPQTALEQLEAAEQPRAWSRIVVRDTGSGIPPEARTQMFEPFFTTKPPGVGTGLGLTTVKRIVDEAGGRIEVESEVGAGTSVTLWLPAAEVAATGEGPRDPPARPAGRGETILLCEDDDLLRDLASRALGSAGYNVLSARTPERALELARRSKQPVALLVSDLMLPHMSGPALAARLGQTVPHMRVLYMSGYPAGLLDELGEPTSRYDFLPKPFEPAALLSRVRSALDQAPAAPAAPAIP